MTVDSPVINVAGVLSACLLIGLSVAYARQARAVFLKFRLATDDPRESARCSMIGWGLVIERA
jgi:hypothetical protein